MTNEQRDSFYAAAPLAFNVNWHVRVRLTDHGRDIIRSQHKDYVLDRESDGWSDWQLHDLMNTFGPWLSMGRTVPFETTIELVGDPMEVALRKHAAATA